MIKIHKDAARPQCEKQCKTLFYTENSTMYDFQASEAVFEDVPNGKGIGSSMMTRSTFMSMLYTILVMAP